MHALMPNPMPNPAPNLGSNLRAINWLSQMSGHGLTRRLGAASRSIASVLAALFLSAGAAMAQTSVAPTDAANAASLKAPPAGFTAPAEPKPDESNAQRGKSQPGNNAPLWRAVRDSGLKEGTTSLPGAEKGVLVQSFTRYPGSNLTTAGEAWRQVRNQWILPYGGALVLISALALALFYWRRGPLGEEHADGSAVIERFTPFERAAHWTNAIAFVVLGVSGLVMAFGKFILLPVIGGTLFGWLTYALKTAHNFVGPLFAVSLVIVIITFIKDNIPSAADFTWIKRGGGMFGGEHAPAHRFNAGEKGLFWLGIFVCGVITVASGLVLDKLIPGLGQLRGEMQIAHMVHASAALLMVAILLGHIYMGTLGTRGALGAMRTGYVSEGWAKEHHDLWHADIAAGKIPAQRSAEAAPTISAAAQRV